MTSTALHLFKPFSVAATLLFLGSVSAAQQTTPDPKKVLTPEQQVYQQKDRQWLANRHKLQAQAKQVFSDAMAREKAGDCPKADNTISAENCLSKVLDTASSSLQSYEEIIRGLMAAPPSMPDEGSGPGDPLSPNKQAAELNEFEQRWRDYRSSACSAAFDQFHGGTGAPPFEAECEIALTRNHLRDLDMIYGNLLHL